MEGHVEDVVVSDQGAPDNAATANSVEAVSKKQETVLQDTPQAATVITQQQIEALQITNLQEAQKLEPSLQFRYGNVRNLTFNIRGFGAASSNATDAIYGGVPIYIDGVYQPRSGQRFSTFPISMGCRCSRATRDVRRTGQHRRRREYHYLAAKFRRPGEPRRFPMAITITCR